MEPLPIEWFDATGPLRPAASLRGRRLDAHAAGGTLTCAATVDGRIVPFKFLCRPPQKERERPVIALLPGLGLTPVSFHGVGEYLFETHDLLLIDYACLWAPERWPREGVSVRVMARAVWEIARLLGLQRLSLAGSSLGGGMCLVATLDTPPGCRVEKLALLNPACYPQELPRLYKMFRFPLLGEMMCHLVTAEKLLGGLEHIGYVDKTRVPRELHERYARHFSSPVGRAVLMGLMRQLPANGREMLPHVRQLGQISQPALVVWGLQDKLLVEGSGARLARDLPNAQLAAYDNLAHMPHEESPERVGPVLAAFFHVPSDPRPLAT